MRILHLTDASSSGVLMAVTAIARAQAAVPGCVVELAYVPRSDSPTPDRIQDLTGPSVRLHRLTASSRAAVPVLAARLPGLLRRSDADVVHLHSSRTGLLGRAAALLTGRRDRIVYSPHCFAFDRTDTTPHSVAVLRGLERIGTRLGAQLVLCSESEQQLAERSLPGARTAVLANSVDTRALATVARGVAARASSDAAPADAAPTGRAAVTVVHVGRIAPQKRPRAFGAVATAWAGLRAERGGALPPARFRWLGEGDRTLLPPEVEVTGWLPPEALRAELAAADVLLFTSAGEGMPMSLLEAAALGVPAVAHDVTGIRDVVRDGVTGVLRPTTDELAEALADLAGDPARRRALGAAAAQDARAHHDIADLAERSFAAYRAVGVTNLPLVPGSVPAHEHPRAAAVPLGVTVPSPSAGPRDVSEIRGDR
ncbi:glycosyltransferase [Brachybacterium sp. AOP25-B2-12]|uniref:glycosyltransferase n=1 Tax=Brachybacterium sp. AOP25-B2-12 TaxID=3457710 RepID=UPI00403359C6